MAMPHEGLCGRCGGPLPGGVGRLCGTCRVLEAALVDDAKLLHGYGVPQEILSRMPHDHITYVAHQLRNGLNPSTPGWYSGPVEPLDA